MRTNLCNSSQNQSTVCMSALAATLHTLHQCSCIKPSTYATVHLSVSLQTLQLSTERCCHFVPGPGELDHCASHSEKNYHFKTNHLACHTLFTLHTIWTGESYAYGHFHIAYKFPLPHAMKFHLMNDAKMITAHLQAI